MSNEIFRTTKPIGKEKSIKLSNVVGPMDIRTLIAFLIGVIFTVLCGQLRMVAQEVLILKS